MNGICGASYLNRYVLDQLFFLICPICYHQLFGGIYLQIMGVFMLIFQWPTAVCTERVFFSYISLYYL